MLQALFRKYGWSKLIFTKSSYRWLTKEKPFDDYSSRGSNVHAVKKYHSNIEMVQHGPDGVQLAIAGSEAKGKKRLGLVGVGVFMYVYSSCLGPGIER